MKNYIRRQLPVEMPPDEAALHRRRGAALAARAALPAAARARGAARAPRRGCELPAGRRLQRGRRLRPRVFHGDQARDELPGRRKQMRAGHGHRAPAAEGHRVRQRAVPPRGHLRHVAAGLRDHLGPERRDRAPPAAPGGGPEPRRPRGPAAAAHVRLRGPAALRDGPRRGRRGPGPAAARARRRPLALRRLGARARGAARARRRRAPGREDARASARGGRRRHLRDGLPRGAIAGDRDGQRRVGLGESFSGTRRF